MKRTDRQVIWEPNPGPQTRFLANTADELLYGGAAGGGKSDGLLIAPLRWVHEPTFNGLILRTTYPEIEEVLVPRSMRIFKAIAPAARYTGDKHAWVFPSGARLRFGYLERDEQVLQYQGAEFQYIGWDELTHFTEHMFRYLRSRLRGTAGLPKRVRAGSNPGGPHADWVQRRWAPWLAGDDYEGVRAGPGETLWFVNTEDGEEWVPRGTVGAMSRCFIPARVEDNPKIDPGYRQNLMGLDPVTREQLLNGNWLIRPAAGLYFKRAWFKFCDVAPASDRRIRRWDLAGTEPADASTGKPKNDPDWTVGALMSRTDGKTFVEDVVRFRASPGEVDRTILATAELDGPGVEIHMPTDPGQAGKSQNASHARMLSGYTVRFAPETGDKVTRAGPYSAQVEAGNVYIVRGRWNEAFVREHERFPTKGVHDDQVDVASGGFTILSKPIPGFGWS